MIDLGLPGPVHAFASQFLVTALGMPFEVGKTLLQVEYRPRKKFQPEEQAQEEEKPEWGAEDDTLDNPDEANVYFSDRLQTPKSTYVPPTPPAAKDPSGYLEDSECDGVSRLTPAAPSWTLKDDPDVSRSNGVWGMIRRIRATPSEGLPALWKGQLVSTVQALLSNVLQPQIHGLIYAVVPSSGTTLPLDFPLTALPHPGIPLAIQVASHAVTQFILSPLDMVRTRLIVMPSSHPSTPNSLTILRRAITDEGGVIGLYLAPNLSIPTIVENVLRPLLTLSIPLIIERQLGISPDLAPITANLADLGLNIASLLILMPIETVRRRMQLQQRSGKKIRSIVQLRDRPYYGIVEAMWRIVTEETAAPRKRQMTTKDEGGWLAGVAQLYRGVSLRLVLY